MYRTEVEKDRSFKHTQKHTHTHTYTHKKRGAIAGTQQQQPIIYFIGFLLDEGDRGEGAKEVRGDGGKVRIAFLTLSVHKINSLYLYS